MNQGGYWHGLMREWILLKTGGVVDQFVLLQWELFQKKQHRITEDHLKTLLYDSLFYRLSAYQHHNTCQYPSDLQALL